MHTKANISIESWIVSIDISLAQIIGSWLSFWFQAICSISWAFAFFLEETLLDVARDFVNVNVAQ